MQADPNATGMVLIKSKAYHATVIAMHSDHFELQGRFREGANITVIIGEAIASQPRGEAMAKLKRMRGMYRRRGYNVRTFLEE